MNKRRLGARERGGKSLTIREIAEACRVSTATVSRVLNHPERVREDTRQRVLGVIKGRHFVSDGLAGSLASRRSRQIGVIIPTIANSIYASSTQALKQVAQRAGYTVVVGISEYNRDHEDDLIHRFIERRVEGLVLTGGDRRIDTYDKIEANEVPYVITWQHSNGRGAPFVSLNNYSAAVTAVEHLLELGHRRIGLICGESRVNDRALDRRRAYEDTLRRHDIDPAPELIYERAFEFEQGREAMRRMLALAMPPTAVFAANDIQAVGAMYECAEAGLAVPDDVSIIGFDNLPITECTRPQLTTVHVPSNEMGRRAGEMLLRTISSGQPMKSELLPTHLVLRGSTTKVRDSR